MPKQESMLDKWDRVFDDVEKLNQFMEFLSTKGIWLCEFEGKDGVDKWLPSMKKKEDFINEYFEIDPNQLDNERKALLESLQK